MSPRTSLRTVVLLLAGWCMSVPGFAQTGPVLTVDAVGRGTFDTNVLRSAEPAEGYGGGGDLLLRAANRLRGPTLQLEYAASLRQSTLENPNNGVGHRVNALAGLPFASWLRLDMIGRGSRGGADEDQTTGDELMLATRVELQPVRATRLRGYGAYRWRQAPAAEVVSNGQYGGVELRQRIGRSTTLLADARYEEFHGPDSSRDWYRQGVTFGLGQSIFRNTAIEAEVRFREREYPGRLVAVEDATEPRFDTDRRYGVALVFDNGTGTEIRLEVERDERLSNDADRAWQADRATFVVRQRLFALGGRRDPPRIDERPATDAIHRSARRDASAGAFTDVLVAGTGICGIADEGALCWPAPSASMAVGTPELVPGRWQRVEAAAGRACGLDPAGRVYCWSWPTPRSGGTTSAVVSSYQHVRSEVGFVDLAVGPTHACALTTDGRAYCWGENADGQLGNDQTRPAAGPVAVVGEVRFKAITAGARHTCGLDLRGSVHCWGDNQSGQSAAGRLRRAFRPTRVDGHAFAAITAGARHTCALTENGQAFCWGDNAGGQLGALDAGIATRPTPVAADVRFTSIAAGWAHTCALSDTGRAYCWGANAYGQLGIGRTDAESHPHPVPVAVDRTFIALSASFRTCALDAGRQLYCWGGAGQDVAADIRAALPSRLAGPR
jgi:hypothetical protein